VIKLKNYILYALKSKLNINIKGNNIERFIRRLKSNNIEILNITYISKDEINIKIYENDYDKVIKLKTVYEIDILDYFGTVKVKNNILSNKFIIISILIALIVLYFLSNMIFYVDIITNDSKMEQTLKEELSDLGIKKYKFKKSYNKLQEIKKIIITEYRNELEWIEIENVGTKYIIRYEPRIVNQEKIDTPLRHIVAKKDAVITSMNIANGQIVKGINSYVKKGEVIVSGYIKLNESVKDTVSSIGTIYGETWYNVEITYPYKYYENFETGKKKDVLVIKFLSKDIELFNFKKYKTKNIIDKTILKNNLLPIKFVKQTQKESKVINQNYTEKELIEAAVKYSKKKIEEKLNDDEYVKDYKILNKTKNSDSVTLNIFFNVIENITDYQEISEYTEELENEKNNNQ